MKRKIKRKTRLFVNDPFGIKERIFRMKLRKCLKDNVQYRTKALGIYLNAMNIIGIPRNEEEKEILVNAVSKYDEALQELENTTLKYARIYIQ